MDYWYENSGLKKCRGCFGVMCSGNEVKIINREQITEKEECTTITQQYLPHFMLIPWNLRGLFTVS